MNSLKVLIGRSSQCDYIIENPEQHGTVSGIHATLSETEDPNVFLFEDHSTNGSYVNGQLLHNASCRIALSDHITLGKSYSLPISDVARRYFSSSKTTPKATQRRPTPQLDSSIDMDATRLAPVTLDESTPQDNNATRLLTPADENPQPSVVTVEKVVEKVPTWYWAMFIGSVTFAFILGLLINS